MTTTGPSTTPRSSVPPRSRSARSSCACSAARTRPSSDAEPVRRLSPLARTMSSTAIPPVPLLPVRERLRVGPANCGRRSETGYSSSKASTDQPAALTLPEASRPSPTSVRSAAPFATLRRPAAWTSPSIATSAVNRPLERAWAGTVAMTWASGEPSSETPADSSRPRSCPLPARVRRAGRTASGTSSPTAVALSRPEKPEPRFHVSPGPSTSSARPSRSGASTAKAGATSPEAASVTSPGPKAYTTFRPSHSTVASSGDPASRQVPSATACGACGALTVPVSETAGARLPEPSTISGSSSLRPGTLATSTRRSVTSTREPSTTTCASKSPAKPATPSPSSSPVTLAVRRPEGWVASPASMRAPGTST